VTLFHLRNKWIRNLINLWQWEKIRFNFVINKISYKYLFSYAVWVYTNFPEIFYIEFNFVKLLGKSTKLERDVMPSYIEIYPYLIKALKFCEKVWIKIIVEWIPLCYLRWYEHLNIDVHKYIKWDYTFIAEKQKFWSCDNCSLYDVCSWARLWYSLYYWDEHFKSINNLSINDIKGNIDLYNKKIFLYQKFKSYVRK
jgi:hypothetical protein